MTQKVPQYTVDCHLLLKVHTEVKIKIHIEMSISDFFS